MHWVPPGEDNYQARAAAHIVAEALIKFLNSKA